MTNIEKWRKVRLSATEIGIRNNGGFICILKHPPHFTGQDERYEEELKERLFQARLIAAAPEMYELLHRLNSEYFDFIKQVGVNARFSKEITELLKRIEDETT